MDLKPEQIAWLEKTAGLAPAIVSAVSNDNRKQQMLKTARSIVEGQIGSLQIGFDFNVEMTRKVLPNVDMPTVQQDGDYDPEKEFDPVHDLKGATIDPGQIKQLQVAHEILTKQSNILLHARDEATNKPLFTDREVSDAIWEPLKRRKILGEAFVPDRFSEVSRGFEKAAAMYEERLAAYQEQLGDQSKWSERLGAVKEGFDIAGNLVQGVVKDFAALNLDMGSFSTDQVSDVLKGVTTGTSTLLDFAKTLIDNNGKFNADVIEAAVNGAITIAQAEIAAGLTRKDDAHQALGQAISSGIGLAVNATSLIKMAATGKLDLNGVATALSSAISNAVGVYASQLEAKLIKGGMDTNDAQNFVSQFTNAGSEAAAAVQGVGSIAAFLQSPSRETLSTALIDMMSNAIETAGSIQINNYDSSKLDDAIGDLKQTLTNLYQASKDERKEMVKQDPSLAKLVEQVEKQEAAATDGKSEDELAKDWGKELDEDSRDFRDALNRSETGDSEEDVETVERLMAQIQKDQQMVELAFNLASMPAQAIASFLPAAGIAVSAVSLVKNLVKAREHLIAFADWKENVGDARSAMSFQVEAMLNRKNNSRNQAADASIKALTDAIQVVTKSVGVAGPFAPAGQIATNVVQGVVAIKDFIQKLIAKSRLEKAYEMFKDAQRNPDDRKKIRRAVRGNATLAKYVLAWGALEHNNPVCKRAMAKCGLSDEVLTNKKTNADKCVSFLEALYPEDPVVLKAADKPANWHPGPIEWAPGSLAAFVQAAEGASPKLKAGQFRALVVDMSLWQKLESSYRDARKEWGEAAEQNADNETEAMLHLQKTLDKTEMAAAGLVRRMRGFKPLADNDRPHASFKEYLDELQALGAGMVKIYRREAEALERMEDALQRHPATGELVPASELPKE